MSARRHAIALVAAALTVIAAAVCAAAFPVAAAAHAALESSDPAAGASVDTSPARIVLAFSEAPEVKLSLVQVLDSAGASVLGVSAPQAVKADPAQLEVILSRALSDGVYTVNWRVVSAVDGHVETGAFAFGVGETPAPGSAVVVELLQTSPLADALGSAGRWLLYAGLILLVGASTTTLLVYRGTLPRGSVVVLRAAVFVAFVGLCLMVWAEKMLVGVRTLLPLFVTREGSLLLALGVALLVCTGAVVAVDLWPRRWSLWLLGAAGSAAMLVHVLAGHAMSPVSSAPLNVAVQWVHLTAIGVWVGGLFWLLLGPRGRDHVERVAAVGRFANVATITLVVVLATGLARALSEAGSAGALLDTGYGITLLVKTGLVVGLVALGALNHFFWVPEVRRDDKRGPRRFALTSRGELAVAIGVLAATAVLTGLAPGVSTVASGSPASPPGSNAAGEDYATTVRVLLTVTPGRAGVNDYVARVEDYDSGDPAAGVNAVQLECSLPARPSLGGVKIALSRDPEGSWSGRGLEFSVAGSWQVDVLVVRAAGGVTVPLSLAIGPASP